MGKPTQGGSARAVADQSGVMIEVFSVPPVSSPRVILDEDAAFVFIEDILQALDIDAENQAHELIVSAGDCSFSARCRCGVKFGATRPDQSFDEYQRPWERHVMGLHS